MSKGTILGIALVSVALSGVAACGGNGVTLGNDGGQSGGGASAGNASGGKGGTTVMPQGGSSAGSTGKGGAGGVAAGGNAGSQTGGSGGTAGSAGTGTGGTTGKGCNNAKPLSGGWEQCDGGVVHRPTPGMCPFVASDATLPPTQNQDQCKKDSDCTAQPYGYCLAIGGFAPPTNLCQYGCATDKDCTNGMICVCSGTDGTRQVGTCEGSNNCKSDADCGGNLCTDYWSQPGCPMRDFACQTAQDECQSDQDCTTNVLPLCGFQDGHRKCMGIVCQADIATP